jgi:hypothetical protein
MSRLNSSRCSVVIATDLMGRGIPRAIMPATVMSSHLRDEALARRRHKLAHDLLGQRTDDGRLSCGHSKEDEAREAKDSFPSRPSATPVRRPQAESQPRASGSGRGPLDDAAQGGADRGRASRVPPASSTSRRSASTVSTACAGQRTP